ncbi:MAG: OsmC family protein [Candidatus Bipolaricaulota bacterium]
MAEEEKSTFKTHSTNQEGFTVSNSIRDFQLIADEPEHMGGSDEGPNPVEYLLAGLGSCLCIMARMTARKLRIDLDTVDVDVEGDIDLRGMQGAEGVRPGFQHIRAELELEGDLSEEEKQKVLEMVRLSCPVDDSLSHEVNVEVDVT